MSGVVPGARPGRAQVASSQINVLFIVQDQLRYPAWFLDTDRLPGLNRLRQEGVWFTNHFSCAAPCSPSRATMQTGMHISQHNIKSNVYYDTGGGGLSPSWRTLGHRFQAAGYRTPYFGKWHLTSASMLASRGNNLSAYGYESWSPPDYVSLEPDGIYHDPVIGGQAGDWLTRHGSEGPWFLTCSLLNPHDIMYSPLHGVDKSLPPRLVSHPPPNFEDSLTSKPRVQLEFQKKRTATYGLGPQGSDQDWLDYMNAYCYYAMAADEQVLTLLDTLDNLGLSANTLVVLTADHGEMGGSHRLTDKGPMVYQEVVKAPLALRCASLLDPGQEVSALSQSVDIVPTLCDLAGLPAPTTLPGKSLAPLLTTYDSRFGASGNWRQASEQGPAAKVHSYVLMAYSGAAPANHSNGEPPRQIRAIYDGRYKYGLYYDPGVKDEHELYDLENDPYELTNLAADPDHAGVKSRMSDLLANARRNDMGENV